MNTLDCYEMNGCVLLFDCFVGLAAGTGRVTEMEGEGEDDGAPSTLHVAVGGAGATSNPFTDYTRQPMENVHFTLTIAAGSCLNGTLPPKQRPLKVF